MGAFDESVEAIISAPSKRGERELGKSAIVDQADVSHHSAAANGLSNPTKRRTPPSAIIKHRDSLSSLEGSREESTPFSEVIYAPEESDNKLKTNWSEMLKRLDWVFVL